MLQRCPDIDPLCRIWAPQPLYWFRGVTAPGTREIEPNNQPKQNLITATRYVQPDVSGCNAIFEQGGQDAEFTVVVSFKLTDPEKERQTLPVIVATIANVAQRGVIERYIDVQQYLDSNTELGPCST